MRKQGVYLYLQKCVAHCSAVQYSPLKDLSEPHCTKRPPACMRHCLGELLLQSAQELQPFKPQCIVWCLEWLECRYSSTAALNWWDHFAGRTVCATKWTAQRTIALGAHYAYSYFPDKLNYRLWKTNLKWRLHWTNKILVTLQIQEGWDDSRIYVVEL